MYALFDGRTQIGSAFPTEKNAWEAALIDGLLTDVPAADKAGGQIPPQGYHVTQVQEIHKEIDKGTDQQTCSAKPDWKLPREIS